MTQPIDVAYVEIRADTKEFKTTVKKDVDKELNKIEKSSDDTAQHIAAAFSGAGAHINGIFNNVEKALGGVGEAAFTDANLVKTAFGEIETAGKAAEGTAQGILGSFGNISNVLSQLGSSGPVGIVILIAAFNALVTVITVAAAALQNLITIAEFGLALLPTLIGSAVAGFGVFTAAISGVAEAFKEQTTSAKKAGAAAGASARQTADAQRGVLQAQKEIVKAREAEIKRIRELRTEILRARVTEARAVDNVKNAELALRDARALNSPRAVTEAQLQLDEAKASLAEAKDRTKALADEKAKADKNGVEGSDQVQRALEGLRDAQNRLAASQQAGAAATAKQNQAFDGLTKSAQGFVLALVAAKNELKPVQQAIQEAFFKGTGPLLGPVAKNIKDLQPGLVRVAAAFNKIFTEILKFLGSKEAKTAFDKILSGLAGFLEKITPAVGPLLDAFASLAGDGGEFGEILGGVIADGLLKLADFVKNVDLKALFADAKEALDELLPLVGPLVSILINLFKILVSIGKVILPGFNVILGATAKVFGKIADVVTNVFGWLGRLREAFKNGTGAEFLKQAFKDALDFVANSFDGLLVWVSGVLDKIKGKIANLPETLKGLGPKLLDTGKSIIGKFFEGLQAAGGLINDFSKKIANSLIRFLNRSVISGLNDGLAAVVATLNKLPFFNLDIPKIPNIPELAKGGLASNPTLAAIAETGKKEAVLPLESPRAMKAVGQAIADQGGTGVRVPGQPGSAGDGISVFVTLDSQQWVPKMVEVVETVNGRVSRKITQKPRSV